MAGLAGVGLIAPLGRGGPPLASRCRFGAWSAAGGPVVADHRQLEEAVGLPLPVFSWFKDWGGGWDRTADQVSRAGVPVEGVNMMAWEAWGVSFAEILGGARDGFLDLFFDGASRAPGRVVLRLFHEMNGEWYPWSLAHPDRLVASPAEWIDAWRHVVERARLRGATNVEFMFCANTEDVGAVPVERYWPGSEWVDLVGVDGYNWGWHTDGAPFRTAEDIIAPMYDRLTALHPTAEVTVGEIACAPHPGQARWYADLLATDRFPRLTQVAFFDERKERDWRLTSDPATLATLRRGLAQAPVRPT